MEVHERMLPIKERRKKLNELQTLTVQQIQKGWEKHNELVCIRPTGFGKTFTAGRIIRQKDSNNNYVYKDIAFVAPGDTTMIQFNNELLYESTDKEPIICRIFRNGIEEYRHPEWQSDNGVTIYEASYALIARRFGAGEAIQESEARQIFGPRLDLVILDEFHHAGGEKTLIGLMFTLQEYYKDAKKLGITATYSRSDSLDVGYELFGEDCLIPEYTYPEAVEDGVLPSIEYFCNDYSAIKTTHAKYNQLSKEAKTNPVLRDELKKVSRRFQECLSNISEVIRTDTISVIGEEEAAYSQKWLIFYPKREPLLDGYKTVEKWYKDAFPNHKIQSVVILDTPEFKGNREKVCAYGTHQYNPKKKDKVITLIFSVGMLLEAVHLDNVTGLLLFTNTSSTIKYQQTLGRVIDSKRETTPLIIDMMDGYNTLYQRLIQDIQEAKDEDKDRRTSTEAGESTGRSKRANFNEDHDYLTKLQIHSHKMPHEEFVSKMIRLNGLIQLKRRALEIMNGTVSFSGAYRISNIQPDILLAEINRINDNHEFVRSKVLLESTIAQYAGIIATKQTGIIDPITGFNYIEAIFEENGQLTSKEYQRVLDEYATLVKKLEQAKAQKEVKAGDQ